jgi:N6-adenosine-specific RNA methylase IME4
VLLTKTDTQLAALRRRLQETDTPDETLKIGGAAAGLEEAMRKSGLGEIEAIRPARELFLDSRWLLGRLLVKVLRGKPGPKKDKERPAPQFKDELDRLGLEKKRAIEAQRIGTLPVKEKTKAYASARDDGILPTLTLLIDVARPFWYQANRRQRHKAIAKAASAFEEVIGPFPLVYADPPWKFHTYSEKGLERTPDQHYPTLSDQEVIDFEIQGRWISKVISDDAALFLCCTSSNVDRALGVMRGWGFTFKTSAVWVKMKDGKLQTGLGLVFRNAHELILYGTRGKMPGPQWQPPSVLLAPRGKHSAKPAVVRQAIERMYPDFDASTRLELFAREQTKGWTGYGYEAKVTVNLAAE